jgi:cytochrome P450 family 6
MSVSVEVVHFICEDVVFEFKEKKMFLIFLLIAVSLLMFLIKYQYSYWERIGIPNIKPQIPTGNLGALVKKQRSFGTAIYDIYKQTSEPFLGIYLFFRPAILIRDPDMVKNILTRDFQHFHDRGVFVDTKNDPMSGNLFALQGEDWKQLRSRLTPAFTSGKLKSMFPAIQSVGDELVNCLKSSVEKREAIDIMDWANRYVIDSTALTSFGLDGVSSLKEPSHEFRMIGRKLNDGGSILNVLRGAATFICPG